MVIVVINEFHIFLCAHLKMSWWFVYLFILLSLELFHYVHKFHCCLNMQTGNAAIQAHPTRHVYNFLSRKQFIVYYILEMAVTMESEEFLQKTKQN